MISRTLEVNYKLLPFLEKPQPIKVAVGGRGSGKSIGVSDMAVVLMESRGIDVYCLREFQESLVDSLHRTLTRSVTDRLQLPGWDLQENKIVAPNGARTTYKGAARNPNNIQGARS
jgi:phage terminase large subunit